MKFQVELIVHVYQQQMFVCANATTNVSTGIWCPDDIYWSTFKRMMQKE